MYLLAIKMFNKCKNSKQKITFYGLEIYCKIINLKVIIVLYNLVRANAIKFLKYLITD